MNVTRNIVHSPVIKSSLVAAILTLSGGAALAQAPERSGRIPATKPGKSDMSQTKLDAAEVTRMVQSWPEAAKKAATAMMEKYGAPQGATPGMLVWEKSGPWKRTIVYREPVQHNFPMPHPDVLEQFIDYQVPVDKFDELAEFDGSVIAERTKGEISARCDKEPANFLAINLADEVATGKRSPQEAREEYARQMKAMMSNQPAPLTEKLMVLSPTGGTADPDKPADLMKKSK